MEVAVLGPVEVTAAGARIDLGTPERPRVPAGPGRSALDALRRVRGDR